jgi:hypothetical protein
MTILRKDIVTEVRRESYIGNQTVSSKYTRQQEKGIITMRKQPGSLGRVGNATGVTRVSNTF